jgi:hypothetical protein
MQEVELGERMLPSPPPVFTVSREALSAGALAAVVISCAILLLGLVLGTFCWFRRNSMQSIHEVRCAAMPL